MISWAFLYFTITSIAPLLSQACDLFSQEQVVPMDELLSTWAPSFQGRTTTLVIIDNNRYQQSKTRVVKRVYADDGTDLAVPAPIGAKHLRHWSFELVKTYEHSKRRDGEDWISDEREGTEERFIGRVGQLVKDRMIYSLVEIPGIEPSWVPIISFPKEGTNFRVGPQLEFQWSKVASVRLPNDEVYSDVMKAEGIETSRDGTRLRNVRYFVPNLGIVLQEIYYAENDTPFPDQPGMVTYLESVD